MELIGRRYDTGEAVAVRIDGPTVAQVAPLQRVESGVEEESLPWIAPGFVDLQVNGYAGITFTDAELSVESVQKISMALDPLGITGYCPTVTTHSFEVLAHSLRTIHLACESSPEVAQRVAGIHLEGPYVSRENGPRGAHPLQHCREPDVDEFRRLQEAAGGRIRLLTTSPEYDGSQRFISAVVDSGVTVAIGHTAADSDRIKAAVDAGARLSTHLGNGSHGLLRRHPNYIWDQLAEDRLAASLIVDGRHLPRPVVQTFVRAKTPPRCILVSDITAMAGSEPGLYRDTSLGDVEVLPDGTLVIAGQRELLAGASQPIGVGVANVMRFAGVDLSTAVQMAAAAPARLIGAEAGGLVVGAAADLVQFDLVETAAAAELTVRATVKAGRLVYRRD